MTTPMPTRLAQLRAQGFRCHYCARQWPTAKSALARLVAAGGPHAPTWDHRTPRARAGTDTPENRVLACQLCNSEKAHLTEAEFLGCRGDRRALLVARARTLHLTQPGD